MTCFGRIVLFARADIACFAITAALTLSLGIGATTAIFTLIYNTMLKALPVQHASKLYMVGKEPTCCNYGGLQGDEWEIFVQRMSGDEEV